MLITWRSAALAFGRCCRGIPTFSRNRTNKRMRHKRGKRQGGAKVSRQGAPPDVKTIKTAIKKFLDTKVEGENRKCETWGLRFL
jgi:hypothetical protein